MAARQIDLHLGISDLASQVAAVVFERGKRRMNMVFNDFITCIEFKGIMHPLNSFV